MNYQEFLNRKLVTAQESGFDPGSDINPMLFDFQKEIVKWSCLRGSAAIFADCGMGKTPIQLEWARLVSQRADRPVLILCPLAVAPQTKREGEKFHIPVTICRTQEDVQIGINIANYEMLSHFDPSVFAGIVLDESSILKTFTGKTKQLLIKMFADTPYRLCCTATPAPNDHLELGNHSQFLGVMDSNEMISRWFINDSMQMGSYRLKNYARKDFWKWVCSWAVCLAKPSDLGYPDGDFILPNLSMIQHIVEVDQSINTEGMLFRVPSMSATSMHKEMKLTASDRAYKVKSLAADGCWIIWCNTNYEADELKELGIEVRGSESVESKERKLNEFSLGKFDKIITKPSIAGFGMNWQHCHKMAFVGLSYSYEQLYQAIRRSWRFGQKEQVQAHIVCAETEGEVLKSIQRKQKDHEEMKSEMVSAMREVQLEQKSNKLALVMNDSQYEEGENWKLFNGDACELSKGIEDNSIHYSIFSPPFSNLYIYSDSLQDMGNTRDDEEFFEHFKFLIKELYRITVPGRLCSVHCKDLPLYRNRDGVAGLRDFPGDIIRSFQEFGWAFQSRVTIWKDPVIEMQRTKNHGLLYKNFRERGEVTRQGMADYVITFRKWEGVVMTDSVEPVKHDRDEFPLEVWQKWASPVWFDIEQTKVLNYRLGRESKDEKHICPLQLGVIERCIGLWTNPNDLVFSPFVGIGSEGYQALIMGRRFVGIELKEAYYNQAIKNLKQADHEFRNSHRSLFDEPTPEEVGNLSMD